MSLKLKLQELLNKLGEEVADLATLDVTTLSGDIRQTINAKTGKFDLTKALQELAKTDSQLDSKLYVVATTHVSADMDVVTFVKENQTADEKSMVLAHQESVETAQKAREAFINFALNLLTGSGIPAQKEKPA